MRLEFWIGVQFEHLLDLIETFEFLLDVRWRLADFELCLFKLLDESSDLRLLLCPLRLENLYRSLHVCDVSPKSLRRVWLCLNLLKLLVAQWLKGFLLLLLDLLRLRGLLLLDLIGPLNLLDFLLLFHRLLDRLLYIVRAARLER